MNKYDIVEKIGEGAHGVVFRALTDSAEGSQVVSMKEQCHDTQSELGLSPTAIREQVILSGQSHPNIIPILDIVIHQSRLFLVYPFQKYNQDHIIHTSSNQGLSSSSVLWLSFQLQRGTSYLHGQGIQHRDQKPENIQLNDSSDLYICDMGLSRTIGAPVSEYSSAVATQPYRSPELLLGCKTYGAECDVWAIGCIVLEMRLGRRLMAGAFRKDRDSLKETQAQLALIEDQIGLNRPQLHDVFGVDDALLDRVRPKEAVGLDELLPDAADEDLKQVIAAMLQTAPQDRLSCAQILKMPYFNSCWDRIRERQSRLKKQ